MRNLNYLLTLTFISTLFTYTCSGADGSKCVPVSSHETIKVPRCLQRLVKMNKCIGSCYSEDKPHLMAAKGGRNEGCMCCKPTVFEDFPVDFTCSTMRGITIHTINIKNPTQCSCTLCG